jgi:REP element-mobilizing transposase RayT
MLRGNNGQDIFFSKSDKIRMCLLLQQCSERFDHKIEAFCLMTNHIHLAVRVSNTSISKFAHYLAFRYASYINKKYKRIGHLFQGRFKSVLVDEEAYAKELVRYIHLNPVRAYLVSTPEEYVWSSHRAYLRQDEILWISKERILKKFHPEVESAINNYEKYVLDGIGIQTPYDFKEGLAEGILGNEEFFDVALTLSIPFKKREIELSELALKVCKQQNITEADLCAKGKLPEHSQARALLVLIAKKQNLPLENVGTYLGRDPSGLAKLALRLELKSACDPMIAVQIQSLYDSL